MSATRVSARVRISTHLHLRIVLIGGVLLDTGVDFTGFALRSDDSRRSLASWSGQGHNILHSGLGTFRCHQAVRTSLYQLQGRGPSLP